MPENGLHLKDPKENRFEPSFALGLALKPSEVKETISITPEDFVHYVAGGQFETHQMDGTRSCRRQWFWAAKVTRTALKNFYQKGLRFGNAGQEPFYDIVEVQVLKKTLSKS